MLLNPAGVCLICRRPYNRKREGEDTFTVYSPGGQPHTLHFCRKCAGGESPEAGRRFDRAVDAFLKTHPGWTEERPNPDLAWHRRQRGEYRDRLAGDLAADHGQGAEFWQGALSAEDRSVAREMGERMKRQGELKPERLVWRLGLKNIPRDKLMAMLVDPLPDWQKTLINIELSSREIRKINPCGSLQGNPTHLYGPFVLVRDNRQLAGQYQSYQVALREAHRMLADASSFVSIHDEGVKSARAVKTLWARPRLGEKENPADPLRVNPTPLRINNTSINTWFERDRAHVELRDKTLDRTIVEWWDEDVSQAVEDGFLNPKNWHQSAYDYAVQLGLITNPFPGERTGLGRQGNPGELKIGPTGFVLWGGREWSIDLQSPNGIYLLRGWARDLRGKLYPEWLVLHNNLMQAQGPIREDMVAAWRRAVEEGPQGLEGRQGNPEQQYELTRDGKSQMLGTMTEIAEWIHRHHSYSLDHALKHEGYRLAPIWITHPGGVTRPGRVHYTDPFRRGNPYVVRGWKYPTAQHKDYHYKRLSDAQRRAQEQSRVYSRPPIFTESRREYEQATGRNMKAWKSKNPTPYEEEMLRRTRRTPGRRDLARSGAFIDGLLQAQRNRPPHELRGRSAEYAARYREGYRLGLGESERQMRESRRRGNPRGDGSDVLAAMFGFLDEITGDVRELPSKAWLKTAAASHLRQWAARQGHQLTQDQAEAIVTDWAKKTFGAQRLARIDPEYRESNPTPRQGFQKFHHAAPDRTRRVKVPPGWPTKLWMLGSLKLLELKSGRRISGGTVCAATGNRIYIINAHYTGRLSPGERAAQIEYIAPSVSERAGPVWFHPFDKPPSVRETAHGFLTLTGKGLRLTRRGIVG